MMINAVGEYEVVTVAGSMALKVAKKHPNIDCPGLPRDRGSVLPHRKVRALQLLPVLSAQQVKQIRVRIDLVDGFKRPLCKKPTRLLEPIQRSQVFRF